MKKLIPKYQKGKKSEYNPKIRWNGIPGYYDGNTVGYFINQNGKESSINYQEFAMMKDMLAEEAYLRYKKEHPIKEWFSGYRGFDLDKYLTNGMILDAIEKKRNSPKEFNKRLYKFDINFNRSQLDMQDFIDSYGRHK